MKGRNFIACFVFGLLFLSSAQGQGGTYLPARVDPYERLNAKWVFYPYILPYYPVFASFIDINNQKISIQQDNGILAGVSVEKFYPNRILGYKINFDYLSRDMVIPGTPAFFLTENAAAITPILQLKINKLEAEKIPLLELGLRTQYSYASALSAASQNAIYSDDAASLLRSVRWYGYLGLGAQKILSNKELGISRYIGLEHFSIGLHFPLFNQANLFKANQVVAEEPFDRFFKSRYHHIFFNLAYSHALDIRKNRIEYTMPAAIYGDCSQERSPFFDWSKPKKNIFGNFYFHAFIQPRVDSIYIDQPVLGRSITQISPAPVSYRLGYTLQFLGNYKKYINPTTCLEFNTNTADYRRFRRNLFASAGISNRTYFVENRRSRVSLLDFEASGGARIGWHPLGVFLFGGYAYQVGINRQFLYQDSALDNFEFSNLGNSYFFGGISFRNLVSARINYHQNFTNLKAVPRYMDKLSFSVGIGI